jgi:hypothetical protein
MFNHLPEEVGHSVTCRVASEKMSQSQDFRQRERVIDS